MDDKDQYQQIKKALNEISNAKKTLRNNNVIRSERLTGEIGEFIAGCQLKGEIRHAETTSNKGWDLQWKPEGGIEWSNVQVKCHAKGPDNPARWTIVKHLDCFEWLIIIVLSHEYHLKELFLIPKDELQNNADYKSDRQEYLVMWDKFKNYRQDPNEIVKAMFIPEFTDANELELEGDIDNQNEKWEILTHPNAKAVYFAPTQWLTWNKTQNNSPSCLKKRRFVFELYPRENETKSALILRGQLLENKQVFPVPRDAPFIKSDASTTATHTFGYAMWHDYEGHGNIVITMPRVERVNGYVGFTNDEELLHWISRWEDMVDKQLNRNGAFQQWLKDIDTWGNQFKFPE